jgi:hypothetical protein
LIANNFRGVETDEDEGGSGKLIAQLGRFDGTGFLELVKSIPYDLLLPSVSAFTT